MFWLLLLFGQDPAPSDRLDKLVQQAYKEASEKLKDEKWSADRVSITVIELGDKPAIGEFRGDAAFYPASVVKLCYMAATFQWAKEGKVKIDAAVQKDLEQMIGPSSNKATQRIVDRLTGTESGGALDEKSYKDYAEKRNAVNRWLRTLGLKKVNACQKTFDGGDISERDYQFLRGGASKGSFTNRNSMTTHDTALLVSLIAKDRLPECGKMLVLMERDLKRYPDDKIRALGGVPDGAKVWAKAGWVSEEHHEAALIELANGKRFVLVTFTRAKNYGGPFIAEVTRVVCREMSR